MRRVTFVFDDSLHKKAKIRAIESDISLKDYVMKLIREDLQKSEVEQKKQKK